MENIYAQLEIENYASEAEIRAVRERIRKEIATLNCIANKESLAEKAEKIQLLRDAELFLRKSYDQKQQYDSDLQMRIWKEKLKQQASARAEQIKRMQENPMAFEISISEAIQTKTFVYLETHQLLAELSYAEIEAIKMALVEIVDYYKSLEKIYALPHNFRNSLQWEIEEAPKRIAMFMTDRNLGFHSALSRAKKDAFLAADAKIKPTTPKWSQLEEL